MTDRTRAEFEAALERRLARHAAIQPTPPDAAGIAREVMARRGRMLMPELFAARPAGWPAMRVAIAMGLLLLAALATLWLVAVGGQRRQGIVEVVPPSASPGPLREALRGSWLADTGPLPNLGAAGPRLRLVVDDDGRAMHLETGSTGVQVMHGTVTAHAGGVMSVTTDRAGLGCHEGDVGRYQTAIAPDGVTAALSSKDDGCPTRVEALTRTWWRSLDRPNTGGRGVIAPFQPGVLVTLPAGRLDATTYRDAIAVGNDAGTLYAIKDPWGLSQPCSTSGGDPVELPVDLNAYIAYVRNLPGFTVDATELEIGGHPAVHLSVASDASIDCPGGVIIEWIAKADAPGGITWHLGPGDPDSIYLVALPAGVVLLQYLGPSVTTTDELAVMGSIQFVDALDGTP